MQNLKKRNITRQNTDQYIVISYPELIVAFKESKGSREKAIRMIASDITLRSKVTAMVIAKGGNKEQATMVFSDTIVAFLKGMVTGKSINISTSLESYIVGIARHKWYDMLKSNLHKIDSADLDDIDPPKQEADQFTLLRNTEKWAAIEVILSKMATRCKEVIMLWAGGYKMSEIAKELDYKSDGMARKKKSECMKELMTYLYDNPHIKEQLR